MNGNTKAVSAGKMRMKVRGSVLFTTVVVMVVLLILVTTAIGLAGAASKKSYSTWYDNQTNFTAQNLVDNVIESFKEGGANQTFGQEIVKKLGIKGGPPIKVDVSVDSDGDGKADGSYIPGFGDVRSLTFQYVADNRDEYTISGLSGKNGQKIIKVTAEVFMGGQTSTYSTYVVGDIKSKKTDSNGGGYIAMSDYKGGAGSNDAPAVMGRFYAGIESKIDKTTSANQAASGGDIFINANEYLFNATTKGDSLIFGRNDPDNGYYSGLRVEGDLVLQNGIKIQTQYPPAYLTDLSGEKFYNIPYLYVEDDIIIKSGNIEINGTAPGRPGPLNIYCGSINFTGGGAAKLSGTSNIMCMDEGKDNVLKLEGGSALLNWATELVTGVTDKGDLETGNIYCKGNLALAGNGVTINGDLCVVGDLKVEASVTVNGDIYVGGKCTGADKIGGGKVPVEFDPSEKNDFDTNDFLKKLADLDKVEAAPGVKKHPNALKTQSDFRTAFTMDNGAATPVYYIQTLDNIKKQFKKAEGGVEQYIGVEETSGYNGTEKWDGVTTTITKSCIWDASSGLADNEDPKTIYINPGHDDLWINIASDLKGIYNKTIIVDDSLGGSVKFFIEKAPGNSETSHQILDLKMTKIVTKTYYERLVENTQPLEPLSTYPDSKLVPHIYMYASSDTYVDITMSDGNYLFTGDIIAPCATFTSKSENEIKKDVTYTVYQYLDIDGDGKILPGEMANPITKKAMTDVCYIGSLEVGAIDVTNLFGYFYVDDPPFNGDPPAMGGEYSWTTLDGYSTY